MMLIFKEKFSEIINILLFYILTIFPYVHLLCFIKINGVNLNIINTLTTLIYVGLVYIWAIFCNKKTYISVVAIVMGISSVLCILISLKDMGTSVYDAMFAGVAVLTVFFVFENVDALLKYVIDNSKYLSFIIFIFLVYSVILFVFFPELHTEWGKGIYYFGHRYASVCGCMMIIIGLKLICRPRYKYIYWLILLCCFLVCYTTGARVYIFANLGIFYSIIFTFRKNTLDFIIKCMLITVIAIVVMFNSSIHQKSANITDAFMVEVESSTGKDSITNDIQEDNIENNTQENVSDNDIKEDIPEMKLDIKGREYGFFDGVSNGRLSMWNNTMNAYLNLPIVNMILGSGNKYMYECNKVLLDNNDIGIHSHQDFLNILHFNGAIGLVIYLIIFIGYVAFYWRKNKLPFILVIGFWGVWFFMALLNGYANYTANMISLPYIVVLAYYLKSRNKYDKIKK